MIFERTRTNQWFWAKDDDNWVIFERKPKMTNLFSRKYWRRLSDFCEKVEEGWMIFAKSRMRLIGFEKRLMMVKRVSCEIWRWLVIFWKSWRRLSNFEDKQKKIKRSSRNDEDDWVAVMKSGGWLSDFCERMRTNE